MNQNVPNMAGMEPHKKSYGPLIAVVVILFIIIIGGLYFLGQRIGQKPYPDMQNGEIDSITASLNAQSNSDDLSSIEADLNATNIDNVDQGAAVVESEMQ